MLKDPVSWNKKASALYALGVWTMIGAFGYLSYTGHYDGMMEKKEEEESDDPNKYVYKSDYNKTVMTRKKDFVPFSTRIYNLFQFRGDAGPGDDGGK